MYTLYYGNFEVSKSHRYMRKYSIANIDDAYDFWTNASNIKLLQKVLQWCDYLFSSLKLMDYDIYKILLSLRLANYMQVCMLSQLHCHLAAAPPLQTYEL